MLKNCDNQFKFGQFRKTFLLLNTKRFSLEPLNHTDQIEKKPRDLLVNTSSGNQARSQKF